MTDDEGEKLLSKEDVNAMKAVDRYTIKMIHDLAGDPEHSDMLTNIRYTLTYKSWPKWLTDEDRLFLTFSSYAKRFGYKMRRLGPISVEESFEEVKKWIRQDQA
jgi:hypothetical protein